MYTEAFPKLYREWTVRQVQNTVLVKQQEACPLQML